MYTVKSDTADKGVDFAAADDSIYIRSRHAHIATMNMQSTQPTHTPCRALNMHQGSPVDLTTGHDPGLNTHHVTSGALPISAEAFDADDSGFGDLAHFAVEAETPNIHSARTTVGVSGATTVKPPCSHKADGDNLPGIGDIAKLEAPNRISTPHKQASRGIQIVFNETKGESELINTNNCQSANGVISSITAMPVYNIGINKDTWRPFLFWNGTIQPSVAYNTLDTSKPAGGGQPTTRKDASATVGCLQSIAIPSTCYNTPSKQAQRFGGHAVASAVPIAADQVQSRLSNGQLDTLQLTGATVKDEPVRDTTSISNLERTFNPNRKTKDKIVTDTQSINEISEKHSSTLLLATYSDISSDDESETSTDEADSKSLPKKRRKSSVPMKSAEKADPRFKGATLWLQTSYRNGQSRLDISAFYSNVNVGLARSQRPRYCSVGQGSSPEFYSHSETDENISPPHGKETYLLAKTCASCRTRRTPLWRDAEDGTPLCNACGIRYKKYRLRCSKCWHIPKKDIKTYPNCPACGAALRYSFHRRTW